MQIKQAQGYSKEKALENAGLEVSLEMLKNATQAWKKEGSPLGDKAIRNFISEYIKKNKAAGAYIVVDGATDDTRLRPYTVINEVTDGKRKTKTVYQIKEATLKTKTEKVTDPETGKEKEIITASVVSLGAVVGRADKKDDALKLMKEFIQETKGDFAIEIAKEVVEGKKFAAYGKYSPSASAKVGTFLFAVAE